MIKIRFKYLPSKDSFLLKIAPIKREINEKTKLTPTPYIICLTKTCCSLNGFAASGLILKLPMKINPKKKQAERLINTNKPL